MKRAGLTILAAGVLLALGTAEGRGAEKDDVQGTWVATSIEVNGNPAPANEVRRTRFAFRGGKLLVRGARDDGREVEGNYKTDPGKSPKQVDFTIGNKSFAGIYEVRGDELRLCFENGGRAENRPKKFATNRQDELVLMVFKRQKP